MTNTHKLYEQAIIKEHIIQEEKTFVVCDCKILKDDGSTIYSRQKFECLKFLWNKNKSETVIKHKAFVKKARENYTKMCVSCIVSLKFIYRYVIGFCTLFFLSAEGYFK